MKNIGILFDVSGSMKEKFNNLDKVKKISKKSDELIEVLKIISYNSQANIFSILFGLYNDPYIIDFIKILRIYNSKLKELKCEDENNSEKIFRDKLISYLSKDKDGNDRYCNIRDYVMSDDGPSEKLSEFFCNLMEEERTIIDNIYNHLPEEVTDKNKNFNLKAKINLGKCGGEPLGFGLGLGLALGVCAFFPPAAGALAVTEIATAVELALIGIGATSIAGAIGGGVGSYKTVDGKVKNSEKEETLKAIRNSFKESIEIITEKVMNKYKGENNTNYELIKGNQLSELIENLSKKIISKT